MPEANLYKRDGIWWLRATVKGTEYRESLRTGDVKVARKIRDHRIREIKEQAWHGKNAGIPWKAAVAAWMQHVDGQLAASTARRYAVSLAICEPYLAAHHIDQISGRVIMDLISRRLSDGAKPATVRRDLTAISQVLEFAKAMDWCESNPTLDKRTILSERRDPIFLPIAADIEMMTAEAPASFGAMIRAAHLTGCRQNELVTARWSAFDAMRRTLEVIGKGNKRRVIDLSPAAVSLIKSQPRQLKSDLIFCREGGLAYAEAASFFSHLRRAVARKAMLSSIPFTGFRFHDLRHLFAVQTLKGELEIHMGIYDLSAHLGHTSVKTTEIYLEFLAPTEQKEAKRGSAQKTAHSQKFGTIRSK